MNMGTGSFCAPRIAEAIACARHDKFNEAVTIEDKMKAVLDYKAALERVTRYETAQIGECQKKAANALFAKTDAENKILTLNAQLKKLAKELVAKK